MTLEEIFSKIAAHLVEGLMFHSDLMNCYLFLGLNGYAKCHEYRYLDESKSYIRLCRYFADHHRGIIHPAEFRIPDIVPKSWYGKKKEDMNTDTRKTAIKVAFEEWVRWEEKTKALLESSYNDLTSIGEVASALFLSKYIEDVDEELALAADELIQKEFIAYDTVSIVEEQETVFKKYKARIASLW